MAITPKFNVAALEAALREKIRKIELVTVNFLTRAGENFVRNARQNATFQDRTGNLRNSIGFVIFKDGRNIAQDFNAEITADTILAPAGIGAAVGTVLANRIASEFGSGLVLVVVAGMEYAAAVESMGFDVLTSSSLLAVDELKHAMEFINAEIPKMK